MNDTHSRLDRLEARDAAREILVQALLAHAIYEAPDADALLSGLRKGVDGILASPEWRDGRAEHAQAATRQEITDAFDRAFNVLRLKERALDAMIADRDRNESRR